MFIYLNGNFVKKKEAKISVFDRGYLYGDGIFETLRVWNGKIFELDEHITRLFASSKAIMLSIPYSSFHLKKIINDTIKINKLKDARIRISITRGESKIGFKPTNKVKPTLVVIATPITKSSFSKLYKIGIEMMTVSTRRNFVESINPQIKSLNCLNNILAEFDIFEENIKAIMLNREGYITEGSNSNIFIVKNEKIITPPLEVGILGGITRNIVLNFLCQQLNYLSIENPLTNFDLYNADEIFLTCTTIGILPVVKVDNRQINNGKPGNITKKFIQKYAKLHR